MTSSDSSWISSLLKLPSLPTAFSGLKRRNWQESGAVSCLPCQSCCWAAVPAVYASDIVPRVPSNLGAWQCWSFLIKVSDYFYPFLIQGRCFPGVDAGGCSGVRLYPHCFAWEFMRCTPVRQWVWRQALLSCCFHFPVNLHLLKHLYFFRQ